MARNAHCHATLFDTFSPISFEFKLRFLNPLVQIFHCIRAIYKSATYSCNSSNLKDIVNLSALERYISAEVTLDKLTNSKLLKSIILELKIKDNQGFDTIKYKSSINF